MATIFDLPREIRDQIIEEAIGIRHAIPASPSKCTDRVNLPNTFDSKWAPETNIYVQRPQHGSAQASLLRTNRQLNAETRQAMRRLEAEPYLLDVMFVKHCGIFPTWYSFPCRRRQIRVLHVRLRIFDATEDLDPKWLEKAVFTGSEDGSVRTGWNMMVLLTVFLLHGFQDRSSLPSEAQQRADHNGDAKNCQDGGDAEKQLRMVRHTIKRVELYVDEPDSKAASATDDSSSSSSSQGQCAMSDSKRNTFGNTFFRRHPIITPAGPTEQSVCNSVMPQQQRMLSRISRTIGIMCNHTYPYDLYGSLLFRNIGSVRLWAGGGAFWGHRQMTMELCRHYGLGVEALAEAYPGWLRDTVRRMKQEGLWDARCAVSVSGRRGGVGTNEGLFG